MGQAERREAALLLLDLAGRLGREMRRQMDPELRAQGMASPLEVRVCGAIDDPGPLRPVDLARHLQLPVSTLSELSDRLVQAGVLSRERNPNDRRSVVLAPTATTHQVVSALREAATGWLTELLVRIDDDALRALMEALRKTADQLPPGDKGSCD